MSNELYAGLISGTSMDGIDVVLMDFAGTLPRVLAAATIAWSPTLRERLQSAANGTFLTADQFAALDAEAGEAFATAALAVIPADYLPSVKAIGTHGQTLAHAPDRDPGYTLQIGDAARIAERSGVTTVADFRSRDVAAGGQGAPMVPAFHHAMFAEKRRNRVVLNIGGIANITCLVGDDASAVFGFDTGPGNCLMDGWCRRHRGQAFDAGAEFAAQGIADQDLLAELLSDPYFAAEPPKSTGTDYFSAAWLDRRLSNNDIRPADVQATLLALSVASIADAIESRVASCDEVLVCGGGVHNPLLMQALQQRLTCPVVSTAEFGLQPDWVEGAAFAWLARQTLNGQPGNLPGVTGAAGPRILGAIHPA